MMGKRKRKIISCLLSINMFVGMMSVPCYAAEENRTHIIPGYGDVVDKERNPKMVLSMYL